MQVFEYTAGHGRYISLLLAGLMTGALFLSACENPGSVGSGFVNEETEIVVDTLEVTDFREHTFTAYSGNYPFTSAGEFDDPLFGTLRAISYLKPTLPATSDDATFLSDAEMKLDLHVNQEEIYGDSLVGAQFDVVEVGELWRGGAFRLDDQVALGQATLGSFTMGTEENILVDLQGDWVGRYREHYLNLDDDRDSLYRYNFYGLAIVPRNSGKIIPIDTEESQFFVYNADVDTLNFGLSTWGYSLERGSVPAGSAEQSALHSTIEQVVSFELNSLQDAVGSLNLSRVELVVYEDSLLMESSLDGVSASATRPEMPRLRLQRVEEGTTPESIDPGSSIATGRYDPDDQAYHFNLTDFVRSGGLEASEGFEYYLTGPQHIGIIRSSLLFNENAPPEKRPKLIVTSIQTAQN